MTVMNNDGGPQEVPYSGWQLLADVLHLEDELFRKLFFLEGYVFSSNIYTIVGSYLTIVDPGNDYTAFLEFSEFGRGPTDIKKIVLTHQHQDHTMGIFELLRGYPSIVERGGFEVILHEANPPQLKEMVRQFGCQVTEVKGGETLELSGFEWEVIHTPGHTLDGICLFHAPTRTAFTGDTVMPARPWPNRILMQEGGWKITCRDCSGYSTKRSRICCPVTACLWRQTGNESSRRHTKACS